MIDRVLHDAVELARNMAPEASGNSCGAPWLPPQSPHDWNGALQPSSINADRRDRLVVADSVEKLGAPALMHFFRGAQTIPEGGDR